MSVSSLKQWSDIPARRVGLFGAFLLLAAGLQGCSAAGVAVGAAATTGVAVAQERPVGQAIDDTTISTRLAAALLEEDPTLFRKVEVEVVEGRVLLAGAVKDPQMRVDAARIAWQIPGVAEVINEIEVTDKSGFVSYAKDSWITTQLRTKLLTDTEVLDINYSIETVNGAVYLMGVAQDEAELRRVTDYARNISGVKKVVSHVRLKDDPSRRG